MAATSQSKHVLSKRSLEFVLYEWLDVTALTTRSRFAEHSRNTFDAMLDVSADIAETYFLPHNRKSDLREPWLERGHVHVIPEVRGALKALAESGLLTAPMDESLGGIQLPNTVYRACFTWLQAANIATSSYAMLTVAGANLLTAHGSDNQIQRFVPPMLDGRWFGTMCLSEPNVGSALGDLTCQAIPQPDGTYRLYGSKMWISGGDHEISENIVHLVLARVAGAPAGVNGLSLFVVPRNLVSATGQPGARNDVSLIGLNHKMGYRGIPNTMLAFGGGEYAPDGRHGAIGYLIGCENEGLRYMFHMMNEARIAIGAGAVALGCRGYITALDYARTRLQGRPVEDKNSSAAPVPIIRHADVRRMQVSSKAYVEGGLALVLYAARLQDDADTADSESDRQRARLLLDILTPIVKTWPSQWCLLANDHAIQVLGGAGYTRDHDVEQLYRDGRLNAIHEGTHGIQAIDLLARKVRAQDGRGLQLLTETMRATAARAPSEWASQASELQIAISRLEAVTAKLWRDGDPKTVLSNAWTYMEAMGHTVMAWIWLELAMAARDTADPCHAGKRLCAEYFYAHELPRTGPQFDLLERGDTLLADLQEEWL